MPELDEYTNSWLAEWEQNRLILMIVQKLLIMKNLCSVFIY